MPAGIISQPARGGVSLETSSCGLAAPTILPPLFSIPPLMPLMTSAVIVATSDSIATVLRITSGSTSVTTTSWPALASRHTMFCPMRPRPTIPSCTAVTPCQRSLVGEGGGRRAARPYPSPLARPLVHQVELLVAGQHDVGHPHEQAGAEHAGDGQDLRLQPGRVGDRPDLAVEDVVVVVGQGGLAVLGAPDHRLAAQLAQ